MRKIAHAVLHFDGGESRHIQYPTNSVSGRAVFEELAKRISTADWLLVGDLDSPAGAAYRTDSVQRFKLKTAEEAEGLASLSCLFI